MNNATIEHWENHRRVPAAERQREALAACQPSWSPVAALVAALHEDIGRRLDRFAVDLQTHMPGDGRIVTSAEARAALGPLPRPESKRRRQQ